MPELHLVDFKVPGDEPPPARVVLPSSGLSAERVVMRSSAPYEFSVTGAANYLALHDIVMTDGEMSVGGGSPIAEHDLRGKLTFIPAGVPVRGWSDPRSRRNSFTAIHFEEGAIPEPLLDLSVWRQPMIYFRDSRLAATLTKLDRALRRGEPFMELLGASLCELAIVEMALGRKSASSDIQKRPALRAADIDSVRQFIHAHMAGDITLGDMAKVAGLSKFHFCRAYKSATGRTPYREVLLSRVDAARALLSEGVSIQSTAARTGFANPSQFSRTFKQLSGVSPSTFARSGR